MTSMRSDENASRVGTVLSSYIVPIPLMLLATGLRLYVKLRKAGKDKIALDDCLIVFATICAVGECTVGLVYGPPHGFGRHISTISAQDLMTFEIGNYIFSHFYNITLGMIKLSILTFYYRIFITPVFRRVVLMTIVFIALWILTITIILALQCRPIERFWNPQVEGTCFNLVAFSYFTNISNLATDIWIFLLPIPLITRLQISGGRKLGLCGVFMIGLATCIISSVRLSVVVAQGSSDFTWDGVPLGAMSVFEPLGGILSANLPITYVLFANSFRRLRSSFSKTFSGISSRSSKSVIPFSQESSRFRKDQIQDKSTEDWTHLREVSCSTQSKTSDYAIVAETEIQTDKANNWKLESSKTVDTLR